MRTSFLSTITFNNSPRASLPRLQAEVVKANTELTTGARADLALDLGVRVGQSVSLRQEKASLKALMDSNALATAQLDTAETALGDLTKTADALMKTLIAAPAELSAETIRDDGRNSLTALIATVNVTDGRRYVFGGTNTGQKPLNDFAPGPKAALNAAFATAFAATVPAAPANPDDPAVANITPAQMKAFLNRDPLTPNVPSPFEALFQGTAWSGDPSLPATDPINLNKWSNATDGSRFAQISPSEKVPVSSSANDDAMRKLAMVFTMVGELGTANLNTATLQVVIEKARDILGPATSDLTSIGGAIGTSQKRIETANEIMKRTSKTLDDRMVALEGVDPAEAKSRLDMLTTQIEMSYSLTSQIMKLSIINYV